MTLTPTAPIDPLRSERPGVYSDELVEVVRDAVAPEHAIRTPSFAFWTDRERIHLVHDLRDDLIDNDLAGLVAGELFAPGWLEGSELFERLMTGVVVSTAPDPLAAWTLFYRNTLDRLADAVARGDDDPSGGHGLPEGSLAGYAPVYRRAHELIDPGSMLELGSCFGFFSLLSAEHLDVTASDLTPNTVRLLARVAPRLGRRLDTVVCDAARVPRDDSSFDTVVALHLLEHMSPEHGRSVLGEMQRVARRRVVVAVPYEDEPTAAYGHVRTFGHDELVELGARSGWPWQVHDHHGGWLVLDRR
ncbi:mycofactocin oligosaccharide methyltransferase MftM [Pimelobacter simplex]|uniref:mycofactocin oligosaccharide methyltransferase MftM n=1 Tax=Nocardioides simplex TaxID=2045 RepID=UPI001932F1CD|nr:class I SAM-dependent methyltransferase [Pimelobacter simplex]